MTFEIDAHSGDANNPAYAGKLSSETLNDALNVMNYIRYVAGVEHSVSLNDEYNVHAQDSAFAMSQTSEFSHSLTIQPTYMTDEDWESAKKGASSSNISAGRDNFKYNLISGWMADSVSLSNLQSVGHRRNVLSPYIREVGFGYGYNSNSTYGHYLSNFNDSIILNPSTTQSEKAIAWPAQNTPTDLFYPAYPWSYQTFMTSNYEWITQPDGTRIMKEVQRVDLSTEGINIKLVQNNSNTWIFNSTTASSENMSGDFLYNSSTFVSFRPSNLTINIGDVFKVTITDNSDVNNPIFIDEYEVKFFDINNIVEETTTPTYSNDNSSSNNNNITLNGASSWATTSIEDANSKNLLKNMSDVTSNYQGSINREQFCRLIMNCFDALGGTRPSGYSTTFTDTTNSEIIYANMLGIVNGKSDTIFSPNDLITRQELAIMSKNMIDLFEDIPLTNTTANFTDNQNISSWALNQVIFAQQEGILKGDNLGQILPLNNLSCEEAIIVVLRIFDKFD